MESRQGAHAGTVGTERAFLIKQRRGFVGGGEGRDSE